MAAQPILAGGGGMLERSETMEIDFQICLFCYYCLLLHMVRDRAKMHATFLNSRIVLPPTNRVMS